MMDKIAYECLNSKQKENYNFAKISAVLADYGFNCLRLSDDWQGADFLACHIDGKTTIKVQLKGRFVIEEKYVGKDIWIAFPYQEVWYMYPHDAAVEFSKGTRRNGYFSAGHLGKSQMKFLDPYQITERKKEDL
jgi:hypothetical protein